MLHHARERFCRFASADVAVVAATIEPLAPGEAGGNLSLQRPTQQVPAAEHLRFDRVQAGELEPERAQLWWPAEALTAVHDEPAPERAGHGAVHAELVDIAGTRGIGALGDGRRRFQLDRDVFIDIDLANDALKLDELLHELFGGDRHAEEGVESGAGQHGLRAFGRRLDLRFRPTEEGLARVDQVRDGDAPPCGLAADGGGQLILDRPVGVVWGNPARWGPRVGAYVGVLRDEYPPFVWDRAPYPIAYGVEYPERLSRWLIFVKWLLLVPNYVALLALWVAATAVWVVGWFAILFTEQFPRGMFDFLVGVARWSYRVTAYFYLLRDEYPPFSLT